MRNFRLVSNSCWPEFILGELISFACTWIFQTSLKSHQAEVTTLLCVNKVFCLVIPSLDVV